MRHARGYPEKSPLNERRIARGVTRGRAARPPEQGVSRSAAGTAAPRVDGTAPPTAPGREGRPAAGGPLPETLFRARAGAPLVLVLLALSGCSSHWGCTDTTAERGEAGVRVRVEDASGRPLGVTAEVVDWRLEPHPQVPSEGDQVHFHYRFDGADEAAGPAVDACAVDEERVALGCRTVSSADTFGPDGADTGDDWLAVEHPERVAGVLLIPNDQSHGRRTCEQDIKDGGGPHPPEPAGVGDRL